MASDSLQVFERVVKQEVDQQVVTAKQYPRSIERFLTTAQRLVTLSEDVASECIYALPRRNKDGAEVSIEGPSARFAEVIASCYGNARIATRVLDLMPADVFVTAQAVFYDVENNVARSVEVKRRITTSSGKRFGDDMIAVTANAASSIAARNAVLAGIPKAIWDGIFELARKRAVGDVQTIETKRAQALGYFGKMGITESRVLAFLGIESANDIDADRLLRLKGIASAIKDGEVKVDELFPDPNKQIAAANRGMDALKRMVDAVPADDLNDGITHHACHAPDCTQEATDGLYCGQHTQQAGSSQRRRV